MSESLKVLNNIRSLRVQARELPLAFLEELLEKFNVIVTERRETDSFRQAELAERNEKLEKLRQMLQDDGIDPAELMNFQKITKERKARPAKYRYDDENGQSKTWTGQGRMPKAIAEQIAAGKKIEDFLL